MAHNRACHLARTLEFNNSYGVLQWGVSCCGVYSTSAKQYLSWFRRSLFGEPVTGSLRNVSNLIALAKQGTDSPMPRGNSIARARRASSTPLHQRLYNRYMYYMSASSLQLVRYHWLGKPSWVAARLPPLPLPYVMAMGIVMRLMSCQLIINQYSVLSCLSQADPGRCRTGPVTLFLPPRGGGGGGADGVDGMG
jgi:hypothetical protein